MFRSASKLFGGFRRLRRGPAEAVPRDDTAHLLNSPKNAERLRAAVADLDAGRGTPVDGLGAIPRRRGTPTR
jgi:hypothetical protein